MSCSSLNIGSKYGALRRPDLSKMDWLSAEIHYGVQEKSCFYLQKLSLGDGDVALLNSGFKKTDKSSVRLYSYPIYGMNKIRSTDGDWEMNFVFEDRIDISLSENKNMAYIIKTNDSRFYTWLQEECWKDAKKRHPELRRNQIVILSQGLIAIKSARRLMEPPVN